MRYFQTPPPQTCRRLGVILTCFVDGRKRFRATPLVDLPEAAACELNGAKSAGPVLSRVEWPWERPGLS
jgi:hypothetical protein